MSAVRKRSKIGFASLSTAISWATRRRDARRRAGLHCGVKATAIDKVRYTEVKSVHEQWVKAWKVILWLVMMRCRLLIDPILVVNTSSLDVFTIRFESWENEIIFTYGQPSRNGQVQTWHRYCCYLLGSLSHPDRTCSHLRITQEKHSLPHNTSRLLLTAPQYLSWDRRDKFSRIRTSHVFFERETFYVHASPMKICRMSARSHC